MKNKKLLLFLLFSLLALSAFTFGQEAPTKKISVPNLSESLDPCPNPEREVRFIYRERVVHEERQFRAEHPGCGGDIMMRKWQQVAIESGYCRTAECNNPVWLGDFVQIYDRYVPKKEGQVFEKVGSWQKAWPSSSQWLTETELEEKYGEPIPFPTCQNDCLQAPPGVPGKVGSFGQEDPYYFNNPWLPEIIGGEVPQTILDLREKNLLGGTHPLEEVPLPAKLFWWNVPGWHEGWIENGELKKCDNDDPNNIACVDSYIIRFDNINREDRPPIFYRHEIVTILMNSGYSYSEASNTYNDLIYENKKAYERYRASIDDYATVDVMRYDRDNIIGCDNCGQEQEIWLETNSFNPLEFTPKYDYDRPKRVWMKNYLINQFEDETIKDIISEVYDSYGRPAFFRSGTEHSYTLQAACAPHDYLEEDTGNKGPEASFSFQTSDSPELISPIDPNWVSPYDSKEYDPNYDPTRLKAEEYGYEDGYRYPVEKTPGIGYFVVNPADPEGPLIEPEPDIPAPPAEGEGLIPGEINVNPNYPGLECMSSTLGKGSMATDDVKNALGITGTTYADIYSKWIASKGINSGFASRIATAGGTTTVPPLYEEDPTHCWRKIIPTAKIVQEIAINQNGWYVGVNSGYRDYSYNSSIGGATTSYHMRNMALDITTSASLQNLYNVLRSSRDSGGWTGGISLYSSFIHIDTRNYNAQDWSLTKEKTFASLNNLLEGDEPKYMVENRNLSTWANSLDNPLNLWKEEPSTLVFQDQVAFRQSLRWSQQWYQDSPQDLPRPPKAYLISVGDGIKVNRSTIEEYGKPVLEDCHSQLKETFEGNPICDYQIRARETHETNTLYPTPDHIDREMEFFTLPEDRNINIYSWNVSTCRDQENTDCTDFSQRWRFQLDEEEEGKLFAPKNVFPLNSLNSDISDEQATVGFPFNLKWERRFGARSYVYRIRKKGETDWQDIKVQKEREIYYNLGNLIYDSSTLNPLYPYKWSGDLDLNTDYEWDIKACWDQKTDHGLNPDDSNYYNEVINWIDSNKECSDWRSKTFSDAPFQFTTVGAPPYNITPPNPDSLLGSLDKKTKYPITFKWEEKPGAKSYGIVIQREDEEKTASIDGQEFLVHSKATVGAIVPENNFTYFNDLRLNNEYSYQVYTCAKSVEKERVYFITLSLGSAYGPTFDYEFDLKNLYYDMERWGCALKHPSDIKSFIPYLPAPELLLGTKEVDNPDQLSIDENTQVLQWESVPGAKSYKVRIGNENTSEEEVSLISSVYAQDEGVSDENLIFEEITNKTSLLYTFPEQGNYTWTVQACLTENCEAKQGDDHSIVQGEVSEKHYIQVMSPVLSNFKGVVPCGRNIDIFTENPNLDSRDNCRIGHLFVMIGLIIEEILLKIFIPYSLIVLLLYTGYLYYTALGDPKTMRKVFRVWEMALKGYLLIFLSWFITGFLLTLVGYQFGIWWQITGLNL